MSAEEIKAILSDKSKIDAVVEDVFKTFDKNGDGFIQDHELKEAVKEFAVGAGGSAEDVTDDQIKDAMNNLDTNHDGKLSKEEFASLIIGILESLANNA
mgnify:CR=1 FL=1